MTRKLSIILSSTALLFTASAAFALQSTQQFNCSQLKDMKQQDQVKLNPKDIYKCIRLGWDAPVSWRPNKGVGPGITVGGSTGFSHGIIQAPESPPGAVGAPDSVDPGTKDWSKNWPPGSSGGIGGGSGGSGGSSGGGGGGNSGSCPTSNEDNDSTYGQKKPLAGTAVAVACGGVIPLTTYQMSLSAGADSLLIIEYGHYEYWLYRNSGGTYKLVSPAGATLPNKPCGGASTNVAGRMPPVAQMISFKGSKVGISLIPPGTTDSSESTDPLDPPAKPKQYLVLPVNGNQLPDGCEQDKYYQASGAIGDIVFDTVMSGGCEAGPTACGSDSTTPSALPDCTLDTTYPDSRPTMGGTVNTCAKDIQITLLDRPNLFYPPGATISVTPIDGLTAVMVPTVNASYIKDKTDQLVHLGDSGKSFTFLQGGTLGLSNGNRLMMNGPATVSSSGQVTLTHGGVVQTSSGTLVTSYPDNTTVSPGAILPVVLTMQSSVAMPAGYMAPSSPDALVRLPVVTP